MSTRFILFVGGCADGQWLPDHDSIVRLPKIPTVAQSIENGNSVPPRGLQDVDVYEKMKIAADEETFTVMKENGLTQADVISSLISHYNPHYGHSQ